MFTYKMGDNLFNDNSIRGLEHMMYGSHRVQGHSLSNSDANYNTRFCGMCGFAHSSNAPYDARNNCGKGQTGEKKGGGSGGKSGDKGSSGKGGNDKGSSGKGGNDKGNSGNGGGDKGSNRRSSGKRGGDRGRGAGDADTGTDSDSSSSSGGGKGVDPGPSGKYMNVDDPNVTPEFIKDYLFYGLCVFLVICLLSTLACRGYPSMWDCLKLTSFTGGLSSCDLNDGVNKFFEKNGFGAKNQSGNAKDNNKGGANAPAPAHLEDKIKQVKKALRNANCQKYGSDERCSGLVDYAGVMAGGAIVGTGNTDIVRNQMLCRCMDAKLYKQICFPGEGKCSDCACDSIPIDTLITEEEKLMPGKCWAFRGVGEVQIKLFYPIIVLGTTIHHPSKARLPPGYFSSAPKDFELYGLGENDTAPYHFGTFQFKEDGGSTQIFEVQKPSTTFYRQVKFNFTSNHGNPNYTALYKLELHGVIDN